MPPPNMAAGPGGFVGHADHLLRRPCGSYVESILSCLKPPPSRMSSAERQWTRVRSQFCEEDRSRPCVPERRSRRATSQATRRRHPCAGASRTSRAAARLFMLLLAMRWAAPAENNLAIDREKPKSSRAGASELSKHS